MNEHTKHTTRAETRRAYYQTVLAKKAGEPRNNSGTAAGPVRSIGEVAKMLQITRQAVHQIERKALRKLRMALGQFKREEWGNI
jgi:DNA-directed RNA polymerase sigma subunit (sigma70/sigma32)